MNTSEERGRGSFRKLLKRDVFDAESLNTWDRVACSHGAFIHLNTQVKLDRLRWTVEGRLQVCKRRKMVMMTSHYTLLLRCDADLRQKVTTQSCKLNGLQSGTQSEESCYWKTPKSQGFWRGGNPHRRRTKRPRTCSAGGDDERLSP